MFLTPSLTTQGIWSFVIVNNPIYLNHVFCGAPTKLNNTIFQIAKFGFLTIFYKTPHLSICLGEPYVRVTFVRVMNLLVSGGKANVTGTYCLPRYVAYRINVYLDIWPRTNVGASQRHSGWCYYVFDTTKADTGMSGQRSMGSAFRRLTSNDVSGHYL